MNIDKENYKGFEITVRYNKEDKSFHANSLCGNSYCEYDSERKNFSHGCKTPIEAIKKVKAQIDAFLEIAPKSYDELARHLTSNLTWTGYEDCHLEPSIVKHLVEAFIKNLRR